MQKQARYLKEGDRLMESGRTITIDSAVPCLVPAITYLAGTYEDTGEPFKREADHRELWEVL
jgi:hypothetical protein